MLNVSEEFMEHLKKCEGYRGKAYKCPSGVWTIGYGTTRPNGKPVTEGMVCTREQAEDWLRRDVEVFEHGVQRYKEVDTQGKFDACVDFAYNCGLGRFRRSVAPWLPKGADAVCQRLMLFVFSKGKKLKGLVTRREWECRKFREKEE